MSVTSPNLNPLLQQVDLSTKNNKVNFAKQINPNDYNNVKLSLQPPKLTKKPGFLNTGFGQALAGQFSTALTTNISEKLFGKDNDSELGRSLGTLFSTGLDSAGNSLMNNVVKGEMLTKGLAENTGASLAGAGVGLATNYLGKGITALGGDSKLSRGIGAGVSTAVGTVGGNMVSKALGVGAGAINPYALGAQVLGNALGAGIGPSKEYGGKYGNITQNLDNAYDAATALVNVVPGWGQLASGMMTLNKGLSNVFGSTSGMTIQDSILGSAFMPAPIKWLNMAGANTTMGFGNQSWQNSEKANSFMQNAFGNLSDRFEQARNEAGKTYGLFSKGAYNDAQDNLAFANKAWNQILAMADQNRIQNIRSSDMSSINNQRYAQNIQGGWNPIYRGKQGMKILNGDFNHNIGMRLLSGAALIDDKQMILTNYN